MKPLKRIKEKLYHFKDGKKILGPHEKLSGDCSGLSGNLDLITTRPADINDFVEDKNE